MRCCFVINPRAGRIDATRMRRDLESRSQGHEFLFRERAPSPTELALAATVNTIVAVGGDGTVHQVLRALRSCPRLRLGILPLGTSNGFARSLGIPLDWKAAYQMLLEGSTRRIDLIEVNKMPFAVGAKIGFPAAVAEKVNWNARGRLRLLGPTLAPVRHAKSALHLHLRGCMPYAGVLFVDGGRAEVGRWATLIVRNQHRVEEGNIALHIVEVPPSRWKMIQVATRSWMGKPPHDPACKVRSARELTLLCAKAQPLIADGEFLGRFDRFEFKLRPGALRVVCPSPDAATVVATTPSSTPQFHASHEGSLNRQIDGSMPSPFSRLLAARWRSENYRLL